MSKNKRNMKSWKIVGKVDNELKQLNKRKILTNDIYIASVQAKDIFIGQENKKGLCLRNKNNEILTRKYICTLDYSKEQDKLREVFTNVYGQDKELVTPLYNAKNEIIKIFTDSVISLNFNYSVKKYNKVNLYDNDGVKHVAYVKYGYYISLDEFKDCICKEDNNIIGVIVGEAVTNLDENINRPFTINEEKMEYGYSNNNNPVLNKENMRTILYENGFDYNDIHYIRYKRANGASRTGTCLFIDEKLYQQMREWELMGLKIGYNSEVDLAGEEAYISLTMSGCGTGEVIHINKDEILFIDESEDKHISKFVATNCIAVTENNGKLNAGYSNKTISNSLFDGESLIEAELCNGYGMSLLREQMCKTAAFATRIQDFFKDKGITEVSQLNGFTLATDVKQIKLILNSTCVKYLKFDKSVDAKKNWLDKIDGNFYVVKHEHETAFFENKMVQAHYQLLNTLQLDYAKVHLLLKSSFDYLNLVNTDVNTFKFHINSKYKETDDIDINDGVIDDLLSINSKAFNSSYCKGIKKKVREAYRKNLKSGHVLIKGNYSVFLGNPLHYLYHSIGKFDECKEFDGAQCMTINKNFNQEKVVLCRSPHVACGNLALLDNVYVPEIDKYFALTDNIICLNAINENIMERLSSCDYDSDQAIVTNEKIIVDAVMKNYSKFGVPTSLVETGSNNYKYTLKDLATLDNSIAKQSSTIGEIINYSQVLQSIMWDNINSNYENINLTNELIKDCALLDVMSCICIDSAKKDYSHIDLKEELNILRNKYEKYTINKKNESVKPSFFKHIAKLKKWDQEDVKYVHYNTTMCYLNKIINKFTCSSSDDASYTLADILCINIPINKDKICKDQIKEILLMAQETKKAINKIFASELDNQYKLYLDERNAFYDFVDTKNINIYTAYKIIRLIDSDSKEIADIKKLVTTAILTSKVSKQLIGMSQLEDYTVLEQIKDDEVIVADYMFYNIGYKKVIKNPPSFCNIA